MIQVLIADDHMIVREGLKRILSQSPDLVVAGEACNGQQVLEKLCTGPYHVLLLDLSLPDRNGLDVLKQVRCQYPALPVLILTMHAEEQYALRAFRAGASGYMTKESAPEQLLQAIQKVAHGGKYVTPSLAEKLAFHLGPKQTLALHESLSDREFQVLCRIASGQTLTEVARELCLSVKTVSTHRTRLLKKMRMRNNAELIHYALQNHLVE